ncbi:MAG: hypothetical protein QOH84_3843, partial [Kribbellaceae bacterium]|nr:hypothetical protein [Kribbellaceae bacterium]
MSIGYEVFVNDPPEQDGLLPNGEPKRFSPTASTLIYVNIPPSPVTAVAVPGNRFTLEEHELVIVEVG